MLRSAPDVDPSTAHASERMPWFSLILLTAMGFVLVTMETLPAGLLTAIASGLDTSESTVGLLISAYALGTVVVTVPAITLTRGFRRKPLLVTAIAGLLVANTITAISGEVTLSLVSRVVAGAASGVIWGMFAAYARKISPPSRAGRSLAVVSVGAPLGFALGTPIGSALGTAFGWRWSSASTQLQTALTVAGGDNADVASAFLPVAFNVAIFAAGVFGGLLLTQFNGLVLPVTMLALGVLAFLLTLRGRSTAFPRHW